MRLRAETDIPVPIGEASETIVFLDFDGVLNSANRWRDGCWVGETRSERIDPDAVARVARIVTELNAKVVVSSAWRILFKLEYLQMILERFGLPPGTIIDRTMNLPTGDPDNERGMEIKEWLDRHPQVTSFVILDDASDMDPVRPWLVRTTWDDGIQDSHVELVISSFHKGYLKRR